MDKMDVAFQWRNRTYKRNQMKRLVAPSMMPKLRAQVYGGSSPLEAEAGVLNQRTRPWKDTKTYVQNKTGAGGGQDRV